tara:strand:- start:300 stop:587 length:288 start_codon:yes stop_codon:yes gene_type:complete
MKNLKTYNDLLAKSLGEKNERGNEVRMPNLYKIKELFDELGIKNTYQFGKLTIDQSEYIDFKDFIPSRSYQDSSKSGRLFAEWYIQVINNKKSNK